MISIRKYLYGSTAKMHDAALAEAEWNGISRFAAGLLECLNRYVLVEEQYEPQRLQINQLKGELNPDWSPEEGAKAAESVVAILSQKRGNVQQKAVKQAVEMQHIFAMLNEALIVLAEGKDRSVARLNRIQESLQQASFIEDIVALKSSLSDTMRFVKAESVQTQEASTQTIARLEQEVGRAREFLVDNRMELAGRPEGVTHITESLKNVAPGQGLFLVAFLMDRLQAFVQRYGPPVAEELIFRVIKERLQPLATGNTTFRWTGSSLVAVFNRQWDLTALRNEVKELNNTPLVHRVALGNRTAVLTVKPSHLVLEGIPGSPDLLIEQVDQFTGMRK